MFDLLYEFISTQLLGTASTSQTILESNAQLSLILTHASIVLIFVCFVLFVKAMFSMTARLFGWR